MYRKKLNQPEFEDFYLPFGGRLRSDNRWVVLSKLIPWDEFEDAYSANFSESGMGAPGKPVRVALGALLIKEKLGTSDVETVDQIAENPYLQYFLGYHEFRDEIPFDPSLFVHFRKRFSPEDLSAINESILRKARPKNDSSSSDDDNDSEGGNSGKLLIDATCAPADVTYPTDLGILNDAREKSEQLIDLLHEPHRGQITKPRTYRKIARKAYLAVAKSKRPSMKARRKAIGKQLGFLRRNLESIQELTRVSGLEILSARDYQNLLVISEVYRQQEEMYTNRTHRVDDRIVSISQPHIRPIVRGKAKASVEFGAKISISVIEGFSFLDRVSFDAYNEANDLIGQVEAFRDRTGRYPESVHADQIYRTRPNRAYCKERDIRLSGPPLGRPKKDALENKECKRQTYRDEVDRIPVEGKFGQAKRRFGLGRIMAKLANTSKTVIAVTFIVMNLEKWLKGAFWGPIAMVLTVILNAQSSIRFHSTGRFEEGRLVA